MVITNLDTLIANAAGAYIQANETTFKSTVAGPTGAQGLTGDAGLDGSSLTLASSVNNGDGTFTLTFSDGSTHTTEDLRGSAGTNGVDGADGNSVTVDSVVFNADYSMTITFSDEYEYTTDSLRGADGRNIHHIVHTSSQLATGEIVPGIGYGGFGETEVEAGVPGNKDTYDAYADEEELTHVGKIVIQNGDSAYQYAVDGGFTGTQEEFIAILGLIDDIVDAANNAVASAEASAELARRYAEESEDVEVETGLYSAHHWSNKAKTDTLAAIAVAATKLDKADVVDNLATTDDTKALSAQQGVVLKNYVDNINLLIQSDDTTLDELQEIVDFIKLNRSDLDTLTLDNIAETATKKIMTDVERLKLAGIETNATADQTDVEIEALYEGLANTNKYTDLEKLEVAKVVEKQDILVNQVHVKSINGDSIVGSGDLVIAAGSGGFAADLYFSNAVSTIEPGYNQLSYTPDSGVYTETIVCSNGETAGQVYLFELPIDTTLIDAGKWLANMYCSVSNTNGETKVRYEGFMRSVGGVETTLFSAESPALGIDAGYVEFEVTEGVKTVESTGRYGIRLFANTTSNNSKTVSITIGGANSSYTNTPLAIRHDQLRGRDQESSHPISAIEGLQTALDAIDAVVEW